MNVPLKKRHKYGRINGSASTIHNQSAKGVHSSLLHRIYPQPTAFNDAVSFFADGSNDEGSELESSMTDATSVSRPATLRHPLNRTYSLSVIHLKSIDISSHLGGFVVMEVSKYNCIALNNSIDSSNGTQTILLISPFSFQSHPILPFDSTIN